jgi:hypothetical protein
MFLEKKGVNRNRDELEYVFDLRMRLSETGVLQISYQYSITRVILFQQYVLLTPEKIKEIVTTFEEQVHFVEDWKLIEKLVNENI